jgi:hypothetical protein
MYIRPNAFLQRRATAILTLLAMLVAPLCASICGSRACANLSPTQSDDCHSSLAASDGVLRTGVTAIRVCGLQEFPSAALNETSNSPDKVKKDSALCASSNFAPAQYVQLTVSGTSYSRADNECCIANTSVQSTVLRI